MAKTILRILLAGLLLYLVLALLVLTPLLNILPQRFVAESWGRTLHTGSVWFNPLSVSLELRDADLSEPDGEVFLHLDAASVNLSLASLWRQGWVLDKLHLAGLEARLARLGGDTFNFSDLLGEATDDSTAAEDPAPLPGVTVLDLDLHARVITLTDETRRKPLQSEWRDLSLQAQDVSTLLEDSQPYALQLQGEGGGILRWEGVVSLASRSSAGKLSVSDISLVALWKLAEPWVRFEVTDGRLASAAEYSLDWNNGLRYQVQAGTLSLRSLVIQPDEELDLEDTGLELGQLDIDGVAIDGARQQATVTGVRIEALQLSSWLEGDQISLQTLFEPAQPVAGAPATGPEKSDSDEGWTARLGGVELRDSQLNWRSPLTDPAQLAVTPVSATLGEVHWPLQDETDFGMQLAINGQTEAAIEGRIALASGDGIFNYRLQDLPLPWFNPNLPEALRAELADGRASVAGHLSLGNFQPLAVNLSGAIEDFSAQRLQSDAELTGWESIRLDNLDVDIEARTISVEKLALDNYRGHIRIAEDGSINANDVWDAEMAEEAQELVEELQEGQPWTFRMQTLRVTDSEIDFMDQSLVEPFSVVIQDLNGSLKNLSSSDTSPAEVELKALLDGKAPLAAQGSIGALDKPRQADITLALQSLDMVPLTPYTGTYAGQAIARGMLDLDLHYRVEGSSLHGDNRVLIERLKLGEEIPSERAVDAPLELALAILTDASGNISMHIPVTGNVDAPGFDLGGVITGAVFNSIAKVATSPFSLLAGLVGSEADLQNLTFPAGSAVLDENNREKLDHIAEALRQRPALSLQLSGRLNVAADGERLRKNRLKAQLVEEGLDPVQLERKGPDWEEAIARRYRALPAASRDPNATAREQYLRLVEDIPLDHAELQALAGQRTAAVVDYLLQTAGLAEDRLSTAPLDMEDPAHRFSGVELAVAL